MTVDKIRSVLTLYANDVRLYEKFTTIDQRWIDTLEEMLPRMQKMCDEAEKGSRPALEKLMRWLGFMQGVWYCVGAYTIDDMRKHNMPDGEVFRERKSTIK